MFIINWLFLDCLVIFIIKVHHIHVLIYQEIDLQLLFLVSTLHFIFSELLIVCLNLKLMKLEIGFLVHLLFFIFIKIFFKTTLFKLVPYCFVCYCKIYWSYSFSFWVSLSSVLQIFNAYSTLAKFSCQFSISFYC